MISVLMSTYNEPMDFIRTSVSSILNQTYRDFELVLVVDNPSNAELINELKKFEKTDSRITLLINEKNIGLTASLNRALKEAKGDFIARMDADDVSMPERLDVQYRYLTENNLDLIGSDIQNIDENGDPISSVTVFPESHSSIVKKAMFGSTMAHPTWFGRKTLFEELDGYHDIKACEDYDFLVRAILHGFKLGNVQKTLLQYRINPNGVSSTKKALQKTGLFLLRKNYTDGVETSESEYQEFMNSERGKRKLSDLESYYAKSAKLKNMSDNRLKQFFYGVYIFVSAKEGRALVMNLIKDRLTK